MDFNQGETQIKAGNFIKHFFLLFLIIVFTVFSGCRHDDGIDEIEETDEDETDEDEDNVEKGKWTIMVYLDADNNLEEDGLNDLNEMEKADLADTEIDIIVLFDRCDGHTMEDGDWKGTRLYQVMHDEDEDKINSLRLQDLIYLNLTDSGDNEELDMGDPETVTAFVNFCKSNYPAEYYALFFWNHGGGWRNKAGDGPEVPVDKLQMPEENGFNRSVCWDDTDGSNCLHMSEVRSSLEAIDVPGIDLVGFDACLMGMVEVAYELSGVADYMVASQASEPLCGWPYEYFLNAFIPFANSSPGVMGRFIVDSYIDFTQEEDLTLSVVNIKNINNLINRINTFTSNIVDPDDVITVRRNLLNSYISNKSYLDLYCLVENMSHIPGAQELLNEISNTVDYCRQRDFPDSHGLSIYFPYLSTSNTQYSNYNSSIIDYNSSIIHFARDTLWDEFLSGYYSKLRLLMIKTEKNGIAGSDLTDTHVILYSSDGDYMYENDDWKPLSKYSKMNIPLVRGNTYYLHVFIQESGEGGPYSIYFNNYDHYLVESDGDDDVNVHEPNDDWAHATVLPFGEFQDHFLTDGDSDWLKFTVP
jgi:hypothetical protein